jgi:DNA repair protein RadC
MVELPASITEALGRFSGRIALVIEGGPRTLVHPLAERFEQIEVIRVPAEAVAALDHHRLPANVRVATWPGAALPYADGAFDAVFLVHALPSLGDWRDGLRECQRVLKQRGQFAVLETLPAAVTEPQGTTLDFEKLMLDRDAVLRGCSAQWPALDLIRRELRALHVHHLRSAEVTGIELDLEPPVRGALKRECLDRIRTDLLPSLNRLGVVRDEFERRLIDLKRRIEVIGVAPLGLTLLYGIKKVVYSATETTLFAADNVELDASTPLTIQFAEALPPVTADDSADSTFESLRTPEVLSLIMSGGESRTRFERIAQRILREYGSRAVASERDPQALADSLGIGLARANQLVAIFELGRRFFTTADSESPTLRGPEDIVQYVGDMPRLRREQFRGLYLNSRQRLVADEVISIGTLTNALLHPREVFRPALVQRAVSLILVHNHPSGDPQPSPEDIELTRQVYQAGRILGIELLDHVIVGGEKWVSLKNEGLF